MTIWWLTREKYICFFFPKAKLSWSDIEELAPSEPCLPDAFYRHALPLCGALHCKEFHHKIVMWSSYLSAMFPRHSSRAQFKECQDWTVLEQNEVVNVTMKLILSCKHWVEFSFMEPLLKQLYTYLENHTVVGQKVPNAHRRLICQKVTVSRNLSQKVIPSDV